MTYMLCAGEASGDLHASELIKALRAQDPEARFCFLGGDLMAEASGSKPLIHYRDMAYMGFVDVVKNLGAVKRNLRAATELLRRVKPDRLILVDYPSFNLRLAEEAQRLGVPVVYYISPKVWAWKEWRVKDIKRLCTKVLSILPFEPQFYAERGYDSCIYVGNPTVEEIDRKLVNIKTSTHNCRDARTERPISSEQASLRTLEPSVPTEICGAEICGENSLLLVPGSRVSEIRSNLPIMLEAVRPLQDRYDVVIAGAPSIDPELYAEVAGLETCSTVVFGRTIELMASASAALVTSGTASLEAAIARVPQVVCYRNNGSRLMYAAMSRVLKINYVSLPNLIAGREVVPELLLHQCTPREVLRRLLRILPGHSGREEQFKGYDLVRERLGGPGAASRAAFAVINL